MEESLIQKHLSHYKQATETAREDLAALQAKYQSLQSQFSDTQSRAASQGETIKNLKDVIDRHKEKEARQESLIASLRERIYNTEQEMLSVTSCKSIMDMRIQTLTKEKEEVKEKLAELDIQSKQYFAEWSKAKQEASESQKRLDEFITTLANKASIHSSGKADPTDCIVSTVEMCFKEKEKLKNSVCALEESLRSYEVECKANRETVKRLATDVDHEQTLSASRVNELKSVRQELDFVSMKKLSLERENQTLKTSLQETQQALTSAQERCGHYESLSQDLDIKLHSSQNENRLSHGHHGAFMKELEMLLQDHCLSDHPTPDELLIALAAVCTREKSVSKSKLEMEGRLSELEEEMSQRKEHQRSSHEREQKLLQKIQNLEDDLLTAGVYKDGMSQDKQQYMQFLEQLSETLKVERITADLGFDMRLEAILARAQQLTRQEGTALLETRTQVHNLQRKLKEQRQRSDSKELHLELLMRKVSQLEEEKRSRSTLAVEKDDATLSCKKLKKRVDRLQAELSTLRFSNTELKAQLSHTNELKIKVMEQNQTIEEQSKNLGKLEKNKVKTEMKLSTMRSELQNQQVRARDEIQQTHRLLNTQSSALTELAHTEKQLLDFYAVVCQMLGMDSTGCIPIYEVLRRLEVLVRSCGCHCGAHLNPVSFLNTAGSLECKPQTLLGSSKAVSDAHGSQRSNDDM